MTPALALRTRSGTPPLPAALAAVAVRPLRADEEGEVLRYLAGRRVNGVIMASYLRDNGMVSPLNRGTFYGCRNAVGELAGVALIGHATLLEASSEAALAALARAAQETGARPHLLMGEEEEIEAFWEHYGGRGQSPRVVCRDLLFEQRWPVQVRETVAGLRRATLADLELVAPVQAQMAEEESGVNPLATDREGFLRRCRRRIEQGRVWVWEEEGRLIFKADVVAETEEAVYLEGVWVHPQERGQGVGLRCLSQLGRELLGAGRSLWVLVNERNTRAQQFYRKAGYHLRACYETVYLQQTGH